MYINGFEAKLCGLFLVLILATLIFVYEELRKLRNEMPSQVFYGRVVAALDRLAPEENDDEDEEVDMDGKPYAHG